MTEPLYQEPQQCCKIRDLLIRQLVDEDTAWLEYGGLSKYLAEIKEDALANVVTRIAYDEFKHQLTLRGMVDALAEQCGCEKGVLGIPTPMRT